MNKERKPCPGPAGEGPCPEELPRLPWQGYCEECGRKTRNSAARRRYRTRMEAQGKEVYGIDEEKADLELEQRQFWQDPSDEELANLSAPLPKEPDDTGR